MTPKLPIAAITDEFTPELEAWVKPYVEEDWIVTAFKINQEAADKPEVSTKAID